MDWLIIGLVLVVAFGGVAYALPSKLQRRVGRMRLDARKQGLHTSAITLPDLDADAEDKVTAGGRVKLREHLCVAYDLSYEGRLKNPPIWQLERYQKSQLPIPGWLLRDQRHEGVDLTDTTYWIGVAERIADMPKSCRSVACHEHGVRWVGTEAKEAVFSNEFLPNLAGALADLRELNVMKVASSAKEESAD